MRRRSEPAGCGCKVTLVEIADRFGLGPDAVRWRADSLSIVVTVDWSGADAVETADAARLVDSLSSVPVLDPHQAAAMRAQAQFEVPTVTDRFGRAVKQFTAAWGSGEAT